jgi:hypothetical protein
MRDYSLPQFHLYAISISGNDQRPPFAYRPGTQVVVRRAGLLGYKTSGGAPERPVVAGSEFTEKDWTYYRAELMMLVTGWSMNFDEWAAGMDWSMSFEELGGA